MMRLSIGGSISYHNADAICWELAFPLNRRCAEGLDQRPKDFPVAQMVRSLYVDRTRKPQSWPRPIMKRPSS